MTAARRRDEPVVALVSGGIDSAIMLGALLRDGRDVFPVYVRAGLVWERAELRALHRLLAAPFATRCGDLALLDLPVGDVYGRHWSVTGKGVPGAEAPVRSNELPGRNLLLMAKVSVLCALRGVRRVAIGILDENPFGDATPEFFADLSRAIVRGLGVRIRVEIPFRDRSKAAILATAGDLPLELTFSCARPHGFRHCGICTKCAERHDAFAAAGIPDPTRYVTRQDGRTRTSRTRRRR